MATRPIREKRLESKEQIQNQLVELTQKLKEIEEAEQKERKKIPGENRMKEVIQTKPPESAVRAAAGSFPPGVNKSKNGAQFYRKRAVIIQAIQFNGDVDAVNNFLGKKLKYKNDKWYIVTLEGDMLVRNGDYVIKGVAGEFYPCKESIFLDTYEEVGDM